MTPIFAFAMPGPFELCIVAAVALLLFGSRLPSVCRNIGQGVVELRRGLSDACAEELPEDKDAKA